MINEILRFFKIRTKKQIMEEILNEIKKINKSLDSVIKSGYSLRGNSEYYIKTGSYNKD